MVEQAVILVESAASANGIVPSDPRRVLLGLSLLQRMVMTLAHGGIKRILVLVGEEGKSLNDLASGTGVWRRSGADVQLVVSGKAELPLPEAPFLFLGGMVVFNAALAQSLRQFEVESDRLLVPDENHRSLSRFSGLALCQAASFQRLQAEIGNGRRDRVVDAILAPI
jgi:hypothetical protein